MKNHKKLKYAVIIAFIITILLGVTAYSIAQDRPLTFVEKGIKDTVLKISDVLAAPFRYGKEKLDFLRDNEKLSKEYENLQKEYLTREEEQERIRELEEENEELKNLLEIEESLTEYEKVHATIISRDSTYWLESFVINKGSNDGLKSGMAVMGNGGLIGYISQVSYGTSTVKLLTNASLENKVSIKIELSKNKYAYGLLTGYDRKKGVYFIEGISDYVEIPVSASVTTTGLGDRFPAGLLIGTVSDIETDSFDLAKVVSVRPSMNTENLSFVTVLLRKGDKE